MSLEALERSETQYRNLVNNATDIIHETDAEGHFTFVNPIGYAVMGWQEGTLIGVNYLSIVRPDWQKRVAEHFRNEAQERSATSYVEFPVVTRSGGNPNLKPENSESFNAGIIRIMSPKAPKRMTRGRTG